MSIMGHEVIEVLARRFPQLYIVPADDALDAYRLASGRGQAPKDGNLDHFSMTPDDELREVDTPSGPVEVLFLKNRADFETFLQIIGNKAQPVQISPTVGAITYRGLADWGKVSRAHETYLSSGGDDWPSEFARLAKQPGAFRTELVVISEGPYSDIPADETEYGKEDWLRISREIRLHHECAHVVCRRTLPEDILPVWDEITADVVGLICATGAYSASLAMQFLGIRADGYTGGRLVEYLDETQLERVDEISRELSAACAQIENTCSEYDLAHPFDYLLRLKSSPLVGY